MLDVDRLAEALLAGTQALLAKELAPLRADNAALVARCVTLEARIAETEAREFPDVAGMLSDAVSPLKASADQALDMVRTLAERPVEAPETPDVPALVADAVKAAVDALPAPADDPTEFETLRLLIDDVRKAIPEAPDLTEFALKAEVVAIAGEVAAVALTHVVTKDDLAAAIDAIPAAPDLPEMPEIDLSPFATKAEVAEAVASIKIPEPIPGKDGLSIVDVKPNADGELIVKRSDGETWNCGRFVGHDGFDLKDFSTEFDGERTVGLVFSQEGRTERHEFVFPVPIYRGVWREGETYQRGDTVTWGGSTFIAQKDTPEGKPETSSDWRLSVKAGRNAK
jgi:hypothetical protein